MCTVSHLKVPSRMSKATKVFPSDVISLRKLGYCSLCVFTVSIIVVD